MSITEEPMSRANYHFLLRDGYYPFHKSPNENDPQKTLVYLRKDYSICERTCCCAAGIFSCFLCIPVWCVSGTYNICRCNCRDDNVCAKTADGVFKIFSNSVKGYEEKSVYAPIGEIIYLHHKTNRNQDPNQKLLN